MKTTFGDRLRRYRVAAGLDQRQLGFALGVSNSAVSNWENNRDAPSFDALPKLREALGVSLDALICGDLEPSQSTKGIRTVMDASGKHDVQDTARARDAREYALLVRYRAVTGKKKSAVLDMLAPDKEPLK